MSTFYEAKSTICTACGEDNLDYDACFNCKGVGECINCCGCDDEPPVCTCESKPCLCEDEWFERQANR